MKGFKVFTHDLRPPIQGGAPVWNGKLPFEFPTVELDESTDECGAGWNFVKDIKTGLKIAGLWAAKNPGWEPAKIHPWAFVGGRWCYDTVTLSSRAGF